MKILLLGDASNYHATLAAALREEGHDVTVASDGSRWMRTGCDIDISRPFANPLGGALLYARMLDLCRRRFRGFDVVQLVSPTFASLRPARLEVILRSLRRHNGSVWLTALGTDSIYVRSLTGANPPLRYSEWHTAAGLSAWSASPEAHMAEWLAPELADFTDALYSNIDGAVSALYEYHAVLKREVPGLNLHYGGIPVDLSALGAPPPVRHGAPLRMLYCAHRGREGEKGSLVLLDILRHIEREFPGRVSLLTPRNVPYAEFVPMVADADIVSDQLYSYTPATTALLALALNKLTISGAEPEFYSFIGEESLHPIINADPLDPGATRARLAALIEDPSAMEALRRQGRPFVEAHNAAPLVAARFLRAWGMA